MANFSSKVLGLVGAAMLFAGMSYGQSLNFTASTANGIIIDRIEDTTALVGDLSLTAPAGQPATTSAANVVVTLSLPVTSMPLTGVKTTAGAAATEAVLTINGGGAVLGSVSGNTITFPSVTFPAGAYTVLIQNVRVNASQGTIGSSVTESITIQSNGYLNYASPAAVQVGVIQQGFNKPTSSALASYFICTGNPVGSITAASAPSFGITVSEGFSGAFKVQGTGAALAGNLITTAEQGSAPKVGNAAAGLATHGTRFAVTFANIPSGVTIYVPVTITGSALTGGGNLTLTYGTAATGAQAGTVVGTANNPKGFPTTFPNTATSPFGELNGGVTPLTGGANGTATAYYDVTTTDNVTANLSFTLYGFATAAAAFSTTPTTAITVLITPAPTSGTDIPTFAASSNTAININTFAACATNLLFPFVSTAGFDTGIAISNTGTDPLGTAGAGTTAPGGCTLFLYGTGGTPPAQGTAAPFTSGAQLGVLASPAAPNYTGTFLLSQYAGTGFTGYMIAQCNFLYGHGFAYIDYGGLGAPTSVALGYLAQVLNPNRSAAEAAAGFESTGN